MQGHNGTMQRDVQVTLLGALACAVAAVLLQGAARWVLWSFCGVLAAWAIILLLTKPRRESPLVSINNAPVVTQTNEQKQVAKQRQENEQTTEITFPRYVKAQLRPKYFKSTQPFKVSFLTFNGQESDDNSPHEPKLSFTTSLEKTNIVALLLAIYNDPTKSQVAAEWVRGHLVFKDQVTGQDFSVSASPWMDADSHSVQIPRGDTKHLLIVACNQEQQRPIAIQDNRETSRSIEDGIDPFKPVYLPKRLQTVEVHLIWGGDDQFNVKFPYELDLTQCEQWFKKVYE
jgi:hypothetical protein